jgi:hypothetical protein
MPGKKVSKTETPVVESTPVETTPTTVVDSTPVAQKGGKKAAKKAATVVEAPSAPVVEVASAPVAQKGGKKAAKKAAPVVEAAPAPVAQKGAKKVAQKGGEKVAQKGGEKVAQKGGKKAEAKPKKVVEKQVVENTENADGERKIRSFKVKLPNKEDYEGRFTGLTPYQAANKALSKYYRETENPSSEITFSICESTRKSKKGEYTYIGRRQKLETPVSYKIKGLNGEEREIVKNYKNSLTKVKKSENTVQTEAATA